MSRSGYGDDCDSPACYLYEGHIRRAIRGMRGQRALVDFIHTLDAMPVKELISGSFQTGEGVCSLGALAAHRSVDMSDMESDYEDGPVDSVTVGKRLDIAPTMAREVMYENDECAQSPAERWLWMRRWAVGHLLEANKERAGV